MKKILLTLCCLFVSFSFAHAATINKIAAVVNGSMISQYDVHQASLPEIKKRNLDPKKAANNDEIAAIYQMTLNNMILEVLILDEAEKYKVSVTDMEVDAEITRVMQQSRLSKEAFEKQLRSEGLTPDSLRSRIKNTIIRQKLMGMMVGRKVVVSPEEIQAYYDEHKDNLKSNPDAQLALLVYPDTSNATKYAAEIKKDSSMFEEIAKEISIGPNKAGGGHLGNVPIGKMEPGLAKLIAGLRDGEVTPIITLNGKKAQFKVVKAASAGGPMTFDEAKPVIEGILREPKLKERFEEYVEQLRKKAIVDIRM